MNFLSLFILTVALILQTTLTTLPLVLLTLFCLTIIYKNNSIFIFAFTFGLLLDIITFKTPGFSSFFFVISLFLILIYQRKFEITTNYFVLISSFLGSIGYMLLFSYTDLIIAQAIASAIIGLTIFKLLPKINKIG